MERIFSAQANNVKTVPRPNEKILEINPNHPVIKHLLDLINNDPESEELKNTADLVIDLSFVISGFEVKNVNDLSVNVYKSLTKSLSIEHLTLSPLEVDISEVELAEDDKIDGSFIEDIGMDLESL